MKINIYSIEKTKSKAIENLLNEYMKMIKKYAQVEDTVIFNKDIALSQTRGEKESKKAYTKVYESHLKGYNVALDVCGKELDSFEFSSLFEGNSNINFFIGGAYGLEQDFLDKTQKIISLSKLTYAHKIAKVVLFEQIYRGLCIKANHPYHK
ncbi:MAG: 23S rRNA (pseudouridine(1915)-N(3))-methyltransferase RlmH [Sulfurospirillaceae bacterium]|nr:23S rRNA (pseudouridine(1915)-N(3))-methyltransferase RlmH [Sulfurospirillaceae bacterium]